MKLAISLPSMQEDGTVTDISIHEQISLNPEDWTINMYPNKPGMAGYDLKLYHQVLKDNPNNFNMHLKQPQNILFGFSGVDPEDLCELGNFLIKMSAKLKAKFIEKEKL